MQVLVVSMMATLLAFNDIPLRHCLARGISLLFISFLLCILSYLSELDPFMACKYILGCLVLLLTDPSLFKAHCLLPGYHSPPPSSLQIWRYRGPCLGNCNFHSSPSLEATLSWSSVMLCEVIQWSS